jgi:hypothetical protein
MRQRLTSRVISNKVYMSFQAAASSAHPWRGLSQSIVFGPPSEKPDRWQAPFRAACGTLAFLRPPQRTPHKSMVSFVGGAIGADIYCDRSGILGRTLADCAKVLDALRNPDGGTYGQRDRFTPVPPSLVLSSYYVHATGSGPAGACEARGSAGRLWTFMPKSVAFDLRIYAYEVPFLRNEFSEMVSAGRCAPGSAGSPGRGLPG